MISVNDRRSVTNILLSITREAAGIVHESFRTGVVAELKGAIDLVTRIDRASEDFIRGRLARELPDYDVVAEESGGKASGKRPCVYADPLDGTTNFAHGHAYHCVTLAVIDGADIVCGVVVSLALGVEYVAVMGEGATRNGQPCRVSGVQQLGRGLLATGFPYDNRTNPDNNLREFAELTLRTQGVRRCGSAALDLCMVADGTYDGYWESRLKPWDLAAGALAVTESGGRVTSPTGGLPDVHTGSVVASNGVIHGEILEALSAARERPAMIPRGG